MRLTQERVMFPVAIALGALPLWLGLWALIVSWIVVAGRLPRGTGRFGLGPPWPKLGRLGEGER